MEIYNNDKKHCKVVLYGCDYTYFISDTEEEQIKAIRSLKNEEDFECCFKGIYSLEYIGEFMGRDDVLKMEYKNIKRVEYIRPLDLDSVEIYSEYKSNKNKENIWDISSGNLKKEFESLKEHNILIKDDIYTKHQNEVTKKLHMLASIMSH